MKADRKTAVLLLALDLVSLVIVFNVIAYYRGPGTDLILAPLAGPFCALAIAYYLIDGYRSRTDLLSADYAGLHGTATACAMLATLFVAYVLVSRGYSLQTSRAVIIASFVALIPPTLGFRRLIYQQLLATRGRGAIVFLGESGSRARFREECKRMQLRQPIIYATLSASGLDSDFPPVRPFLEILEEIDRDRLTAEAIVLRESSRDLAPDLAERLVRLHFNGVPTYTLELFHQVRWRKIPLYRLNPTWLFQEGFEIAREPVFEHVKRASDILFSALGLLLAGPLIGAAALAVWLEDRGPVLFIQPRIGKHQTVFRLPKLRTMRAPRDEDGPGADESDPYTRAGDARVTRVGRFLRATRLDELPQLWNVLRGEMSLIGPRAEWQRLVGGYERRIPCYHFRHLVKPGITGWAQVNYPYGTNLDDTIRKLEYDLYYIRHFSFRLDAAIILKTVHLMLFGKGR